MLTPSSASVPTQAGTNTSQNLINSSFLAQKGTFRTALSGTTEKFNPWIIDSGATDHMTGCTSFFSTYTPGSGHIKVKIANGSLATVVRTGTIILGPHITLFNVLHVPKLSCNLLSISKLTKELSCADYFLPNHCEFQDMTSGKRIGSAEEYGGLYYFKEVNTKDGQALTASCESSSKTKQQGIMLWHFRLGHPNFQYL